MTVNAIHASHRASALRPRPRPGPHRHGVRPQRGVTLLELLIGVGVIIVVMVIVLMGLRSLNAQMDRSALLRQAPQIKVSLAGYGAAADFSNLDTHGAIGMGAFPRELVSGAGTARKVTHQFDGEIHVKGLADDLAPLKKGRAFYLIYTAIPLAQCAGVARGLAMLSEGLWIEPGTTGAAATSITLVPSGALQAPGTSAPIDINALGSKCNQSEGATTVDIHALMAV